MYSNRPLDPIETEYFESVQMLSTLNASGLDSGGGPGTRFFVEGRKDFASRAPGRLDVMGGIADYSGSLVLQLPLREAAVACLQRDEEPVLRIASLGADANDRSGTYAMPLSDLHTHDGGPLPYDEARAYFRRDPRHAWAAYAAGAFLVLMRERGVRFSEGARIAIHSTVPEGKGVSSSAAVEVAVMQTVAAAYGVEVDGRDLAVLCQIVENRVVGAPCGIMDQMTSSCGEADHLLALLCQPAEIQGHIPIPPGIAFWGIDSGIRHAVSGADYSSVRIGAFMGYRILAEAQGMTVKPTQDPAVVQIDDPFWHGYLANLTPPVLERDLIRHLPEHITGAEFLARYQGTTDPVTRIEPDRTYAVRIPTAHPVYEHHRTRTFAELLAADGAGKSIERQLEFLGELMYESHASYSACGLGSDGTDFLVRLVRELGPERGLYGAKITGGGSGGSVAVLARRDAGDAVREVARRYEEETGRKPYLFTGSSPGAFEFGVTTSWEVD